MSKKTRYIIGVVAVLFLIIGGTAFIAGPLIGLVGVDLKNLYRAELPLGDLRGIAVDSEGNIFCGLQFYSRIQVYSPEGKFIYGVFVDSAGGAFRIRINENNQLEVATARTNKLCVFERDGTLVKELSDVGYSFDDFGQAAETQFYDRRQNVTYLKRAPFFGPLLSKGIRPVKRKSLSGPRLANGYLKVLFQRGYSRRLAQFC